MPNKDDIELIAELVGTTNAQLKKLDQDIVSPSANLKTSADAWNPHQIVKDHIANSGIDVPQSAVPPPSPSMPLAGVAPQTTQPQQPYMPPPQVVQPQVMQVVTREFEDRLAEVEKKIDTILLVLKDQQKLDEKISSFVDRGLKDRVKQITLKLDDSKD